MRPSQADDGGGGPVKGPRSQALRARPWLLRRRRENSTRLNTANGLKSLARKGTFLLGYRWRPFYWASEGDISIGLRQATTNELTRNPRFGYYVVKQLPNREANRPSSPGFIGD